VSQFKHECWEWDGLEIDEFDSEFACCCCFEGPEFEAAKEKANILLDEQRKLYEAKWGNEDLF
jgi:hypothetical protein